MAATTFEDRLRATGRAPHRGVLWREPVSLRYLGALLGAVLRYVAIILVAVEAIFISEFLISDMLPRVLEHGGSLLDVVVLTGLAIPDGLYLALPLSLLIAVYLILLRRREASEFTVLAGMGYGSRLLVGVGVLIGVAGFAVASLLAGYVEPQARYLLRRGSFDLAIEELRSGEFAAGKFHVFGEVAVFASRGRIGDQASGVFVHEHLDGDRNRIVMAERSLGLTSSQGRKAILLDDAAILNFALSERGADCEGCVVAPRLTPANFVNLNRFFVGAPELPLPETYPRGAGLPAELTTLELLAQNPAGNAAGILGQRLLRALLCLLAPFLALAAVALTGPRTLLVALPGAGAILLAGMFFGPRAVDLVSGIGTIATIGALLLVTAIVAAGAVVVVRRNEARCLGPGRVQM
jgi:lipopolysaccharide export system permease protein